MSDLVVEDSTTHIAQMLGMVDPWYERNVLSLLSLSSDVLCQVRSIPATVPLSGPDITTETQAGRVELKETTELYY